MALRTLLDVELQDTSDTPAPLVQPSADSQLTPTKSQSEKTSSKRPPILLEWKDITFKVKVKTPPPPGLSKLQAMKWKMFGKQDKNILYPMSGYVAPGHVLAIMGPSGAGTFVHTHTNK
jgi:ABC-type molybdenum transport system ATPase subunit/photorepair protein PhrA